jgi:hypothetical protein
VEARRRVKSGLPLLIEGDMMFSHGNGRDYLSGLLLEEENKNERRGNT